MLKRLKTVSMMLFLMGASTGAAFAVHANGTDDVKITQQSETATGTVVDAMGPVIGASVVVKGGSSDKCVVLYKRKLVIHYLWLPLTKVK